MMTLSLSNVPSFGSDSTTFDMPLPEYPHADITHRVIRAFFQVYGELGYGFLESVYEGALALVLEEAELKYQRQVAIPVKFRGRELGRFRARWLRKRSRLMRALSRARINDVLGCLGR